MTTSRRTFLKAAGVPAVVASPLGASQGAPAASKILVNHLGFLPAAGKRCVVINPPSPEFRVLRVTNPGKLTLTPVFQGRLRDGGPPRTCTPMSR
jgi:hypothetical protein